MPVSVALEPSSARTSSQGFSPRNWPCYRVSHLLRTAVTGQFQGSNLCMQFPTQALTVQCIFESSSVFIAGTVLDRKRCCLERDLHSLTSMYTHCRATRRITVALSKGQISVNCAPAYGNASTMLL